MFGYSGIPHATACNASLVAGCARSNCDCLTLPSLPPPCACGPLALVPAAFLAGGVIHISSSHAALPPSTLRVCAAPWPSCRRSFSLGAWESALALSGGFMCVASTVTHALRPSGHHQCKINAMLQDAVVPGGLPVLVHLVRFTHRITQLESCGARTTFQRCMCAQLRAGANGALGQLLPRVKCVHVLHALSAVRTA